MLRIRYLHEKPLFRTRELSIRGIGIRETMPPSLIVRRTGTGDALFMMFHAPVHLGLGPGKDGPVHREGTAIFWTPGMGHYYGNPSLRWNHSWIHCDGPRVLSILRSVRLTPGRPFLLWDPSRAERTLFDIHEELSGPRRPDGAILGNLLENLTREAARSGRLPPRIVPAGLLRARDRIDEGYDREIVLADLAREAGLSTPHFCTAFRRHFGCPPIHYLLRRRMQAAAALVRGTELPLGEIGRSVGCPDPYYFSKLFKQSFGVSPSRLRQAKKKVL